MIICATCGAEHQVLFDERYQQGDGCSATVYEKDGETYLIGHYGSTVADTNRYWIRQGSGYKIGNCCDGCITRMLREGNATLIEEGVW